MRAPPSDLDTALLVQALAHWGLADPQLEYLPVGFGSHHWRAADKFVTVDDLEAGFQPPDAYDALDRAYRTAAALRDCGLEFVLAPLPNDAGAPLVRLDRRYAVSVALFVDGTSRSWGAYESTGERREVGALLGRLHTALTDSLPRSDDLGISSRAILVDALANLDQPWNSGPFADAARALLAGRAAELDQRLHSYDERADEVRRDSTSWVITHGEPHLANFLVDSEGRRYLVDWDTTLVAPRERDLWMVLDDELTGWDEYREIAGDATLDRDALALYRERWDLRDIATFVADLRRLHVEDENTTAVFEALRGYLG